MMKILMWNPIWEIFFKIWLKIISNRSCLKRNRLRNKDVFVNGYTLPKYHPFPQKK